MVLVDDSNVLVAGGSTEKQFFTSKTFFFNFDSNLWRNGPDLKVPRGKHACGMVQKDGNTSEVQTFLPKPGSIAEKNRTRLQISMQQDFVSLKSLYCEICSSKFWTNVMFKRLVFASTAFLNSKMTIVSSSSNCTTECSSWRTILLY